ncbi:MAG: Aminotransferase class IV [Synergistales bacterium 57_84]|jgi:branched-chain amino acid aminotransferase|nr:MAG: Aminotransferase class IV [Synergistales bacterium 57_84]HCR37999.1 aminotransferase IV [Synergistaceae bacterium]
MVICYADGLFKELNEISLPLSDLAFQRGIGVFETIRTYDRRPMALTPHLERLASSAAGCRIALPLPLEDMKGIIRKGIDLVDGEVKIRPFITGGDAFDNELGFTRPRLFIFFEPLCPLPEKDYSKGISLHPVDQARPMANIKSINYLESFLPLAEDPEALEVLYCPGGEITESSHSNAFMVIGGKIVTAPEERVLPGTMRSMTLEMARDAGFSVEKRCPLREELPLCTEFFITGSIKEILPVVRIGKTTVGGGKPGPVSAHLRRLYLQNLGRWGE